MILTATSGLVAVAVVVRAVVVGVVRAIVVGVAVVATKIVEALSAGV